MFFQAKEERKYKKQPIQNFFLWIFDRKNWTEVDRRVVGKEKMPPSFVDNGEMCYKLEITLYHPKGYYRKKRGLIWLK